jgi:hypothetical protein
MTRLESQSGPGRPLSGTAGAPQAALSEPTVPPGSTAAADASAAPGTAREPDRTPGDTVTIVWVMASRWETVVVVPDAAKADGYTTWAIQRTQGDLARAVTTALNAARATRPSEIERRGPVDALCDLTGEIVAAFPAAEQLLVVPLGVCALLPYAAAPHNGARLVDHAAVTVAPSLAWAKAARRPRPQGPSIGVFHPGNPPLAVERDRRAFESFVRHEALVSSAASVVLDHLVEGLDIAHFTCHGSYNTLAPLESGLELADRLTLQAVLEHKSAPWLVNLSACETGVPDLQASEQAISFPTGFLLAGAAHVLATLWPVNDRHAAGINRIVYRELGDGRHPAHALRTAVLEWRDTGRRPRHPFWWAPFMHYGSPW